MVKFVLLHETQNELVEAIARYENIDPGLGRRLLDEVISTLGWIQAHPDSARLRPPGYHRINLRTFPYYLPYVVRSDTLWILAFAHVRRRPLYWIRRRFTG